MKILVIPDVHGCNAWEDNVKNNIDNVDKVVFLGDYFDSFNAQEKGLAALDNFNNIVELKKNNKDKVDILLGNHDVDNYLSGTKCSGYQESMFLQYNEALLKNLDLFDIGVTYDGWTFSHAGYSSSWVANTLLYLKTNYPSLVDLLYDNGEINPVVFSNKLLHNKDYKLLVYNGIDMSGYGDSVFQTPLWIRPDALVKNMFYEKQVVGHSESLIRDPRFYTAKQNWYGEDPKWEYNKLIVLDSPGHDQYFILDTENIDYHFETVLDYKRREKRLIKGEI
jgi:hypothetical protein